MYVAQAWREERISVLAEAVLQIQFCALVTQSDDGLDATHIPMLLHKNADGSFSLNGHVARANDLWRRALDRPRALAIFQGPQAYIHPGWFPTKQKHGKAVPTWNYIAVHLHGDLEVIEDEGWTLQHLEELSARNENGRAEPWAVSDAPPDYIAAKIKGIVGVRIAVRRFEGNWKMMQPQPMENRFGAIEGLAASSAPSDHEVAAVMRGLTGAE